MYSHRIPLLILSQKICFSVLSLINHWLSYKYFTLWTLFSDRATVAKHESEINDQTLRGLSFCRRSGCWGFSAASAAARKHLQGAMFPAALRRNTRRDGPSRGHFGIHEHDWWHGDGGCVWEILSAEGEIICSDSFFLIVTLSVSQWDTFTLDYAAKYILKYQLDWTVNCQSHKHN